VRSAQPSDPRVPLDGPLNFRDLGGYRTQNGQRLRQAMIYRSDDLAQLARDDIARLTPLGLRTVIDLRSDEEVKRRGYFPVDRYPHQVDYYHLPLVEDVIGVRGVGVDDQAYLDSRYQYLLDRGSSAIAQAFHIFACPQRYPLVFHCVAGKDRTGVLSALLLAMLGVPDATIASDYQLTDRATQEWMDRLAQQHPEERAVMNDVPSILFTANPQTILRLLSNLRARSGSIEAWLLGLDVTHEELDSIRGILLEAVV
jgi:protein-tyrosine phosphatase